MRLPLPSSCAGCVFYKYKDHPDNGFVPDRVAPQSKVYFLGQNPGKHEVQGQMLLKRHYHGGRDYTDESVDTYPEPLIGPTGLTFTFKYLPVAQLQRADVSLGNAIRCRPGAALKLKKADDLPSITTAMKLESSKADIVHALTYCRDTHMTVPDSVEIIVTMGRYAMFAVTGIQNEESEYGHRQGVVESWRGYAVDYPHATWGKYSTIDTSYYHPLTSAKRIFFTMHLAALVQGLNERFTNATQQDYYKISRLLTGKWPSPLPTWHSVPPVTWPEYAAFDTEYLPALNNQLVRWSLADITGNNYCVEVRDTSDTLIPISPGSTVILQNALADIAHLATIIDSSTIRIEDMMLADSVLHTGEPHNLNFIASKYGSMNKWKHLSKGEPQLYSTLDVHQPLHMWLTHYIPQFKADPISWKVYRTYRIPLIDIINRAQMTGARLDGDRLVDVQHVLRERLQCYQLEAQGITGNPHFHLGGLKQVRDELYE